MGLNTRTSDNKAALARFTLRPRESENSLRMRNALAGVSTRLFMAGGRRHVQSESLKTSGLSHWQVFNPRLPLLKRGAGLEQPFPVSTTMNNPTTDSRLWALVRDLEAQGYGIFSTRQRTGFMLQMSDMDLSEVEECAFDRFREALSEDEDLRAAVGPFLAKNRPHPEENA